MDFYDGIVLLPYIKQCEKTWHNWCKSDLDNYTEKLSMQKSRVYNLFYDGMWQRPVKGTYWIHNDSQWANATRYRCTFNLNYNNSLEFMFDKIYI